MTPFEITLLIDYYVSPRVPDGADSDAGAEAIRGFIEDGLLVYDPEAKNSYVTTPKGDAHVRMLCSVPYPQQAWVNPLTSEIIE